jgi:hypothetical protein
MPDSVLVHQALFGYREGHNLLASSTALSPRVRHFLASVTDGSGPENAKGFEVAYTGLRVPETDYYAFFCTWPAPELPRPGCVWSHVILLQFADLARIPDLSSLRQLCIRPASASALKSYAQPVALSLRDNLRSSMDSETRVRAQFLLVLVYGRASAGIVILDEDSPRWESAVFAIWSQQWPRLRNEFTFSTGSLGDRRLGGVVFDLQVAPLGSQRLWHRVELPTYVTEFSPATLPAVAEPWLNTALSDLIGPERPLRRFFAEFGEDIEVPRRAFAHLALAHQQLTAGNNQRERADQLRAVGRLFPSRADALRLKASLIKAGGTDFGEHAWAALSFLLESSEASAYTVEAPDLVELTRANWNSNPDRALFLLAQLVRRKESPHAVDFAAALANGLGSNDLRLVDERYPELVPLLVSHRPSLACDASTWRLQRRTQWHVYEALEGLSLEQSQWSEILGAMFVAATDVAMRDVVERTGPFAMMGVFRWLDHDISNEYLPSQGWREAVASAASHFLASGVPLSPARLALCAWLVSANTATTHLDTQREDVQQLAKEWPQAIPLPLRSHTAFLLVALALRAKDNTGLQLLLRGFFETFGILASGKYSFESWQVLSPELPYLGIWRDWDRCEKLSRAVGAWVRKYVDRSVVVSEETATVLNELVKKVDVADAERENFVD